MRHTEYGLYVALQAVLVSPDFLFLMENDPDGMNEQRDLNDYEVASRLYLLPVELHAGRRALPTGRQPSITRS